MHRKTLFASMGAIALTVALATTASAGENHHIRVTPSNFLSIFPGGDNRPVSSYMFVVGPHGQPLGHGSLELKTVDAAAKQQHLEYAQQGALLTSINQLGYSTYSHATSVNPSVVAAINMEIFQTGTSGYATLVYEPYLNGAVVPGRWQHWNAYNGMWWSTRDNILPGVPRHTPVQWSLIASGNPQARVISYGINQGTANPSTTSNVDALSIGLHGGDRWIYDFEPAGDGNDENGDENDNED